MASQYDYETIKVAAKELGVKVTDLLALASQNDPFYAGTPTDRKQANWFSFVWKQAGYASGVHLRRVHYWCVSREPKMHNGLPYENTQKCWQYLTQASKMARYLGLVQIADIADHKSPNPIENATYNWWSQNPDFSVDTFELDDPDITVSGISNIQAQPYHLEIWCEKSTMNDVLKPACSRVNANLCTFEGEVSITACYQLLRRIGRSDGKPTRIFYISDFDPAGNSMPVATARKIEYMLGHFEYGYDVKLKPIVLTVEQVQEFHLPRTPIKKSERRAGKFEEAFGSGAVELDALEALHPGQLESIVSSALKPYYSQAASDESSRKRQELRQAVSEKVDAVVERYQDEIDALRTMQDELAAIDIDASQYAVKRHDPDVVEASSDWLFDSDRDYANQIGYYKAHKGQDSTLGVA